MNDKHFLTPAGNVMAAHKSITIDEGEVDRARRFKEAALPLLDDAYRLANFLLRNRADAEDAVQQAYLLALKHFDSLRGGDIKPWLLTILRNVCFKEFGRRARRETPSDLSDDGAAEAPVWQEAPPSPEAALLRRQNEEQIRQLVSELPPSLRETLVLREFNDLSYREIADVTGAPIGTVMSRLSRARALLRENWINQENQEEEKPARATRSPRASRRACN